MVEELTTETEVSEVPKTSETTPQEAVSSTKVQEHGRAAKPVLDSSLAKQVQRKGQKEFLVRTIGQKDEILMTIGLETLDTHDQTEETALLDSGATGLFMNAHYAKQKGFKLIPLDHPIQVRNVDGTSNEGGMITHEVDLLMSYQGHQERATFEICELGKTNVIIGSTWL